MRLAAADSFNAVARISNAMTSSARLLAAPSETRIAWCWISSMPARALEFTILCATRTVETIGAEWSEFDLVGNIWTIPAHRMKAKRDHRIPLSSRAVQILELLPRDANSRLVFTRPGNQAHLSNGAMLALLDRMGRGDVTTHGFRSTFKDWASEQTNFAPEVAEMALAHVVHDKVEAAYSRLMEQDEPARLRPSRLAVRRCWNRWSLATRGRTPSR